MTDFSTSSISNSISKDNVYEEMSLSRASMEEAEEHLTGGLKPEMISNEVIRKGNEILETYRVISDAFLGGMGSVWCVHHLNWDEDLAMKRPQPRFFAEGSRRRKEAFIAECENWINLGLHPNIVSCYYVREIGGVPTIFSEWMDGGSLRDRIGDGSVYEGTEEEVQERILDIAIQSARGLGYAQKQGLIHQDVKPGNLLLSRDWDVKVADFGLAKARSRLNVNNAPLTTGYTLAYCPKEQAQGAPPEPWMDVYSWALTVLEAYAGKRFWTEGAGAFSELFGGTVPPESGFRVEPPRKLIDAWRSDSDPACGGWRSFSEYEQLLRDIYSDITGREYSRPQRDAAADTADSLNNRALSFLDLNRPEEADTLWRKGRALSPNHPEITYNYGLFRWRYGFIDDAELLSDVRNLGEADPESAQEKVRRIVKEGGSLHHIMEDSYHPEPKYRPAPEEERKWMKTAERLLPGEPVSCAYMDKEKYRLIAGTSRGSLYVFEPDGDELSSDRKIPLVGHSEKVESVFLHGDLAFSSSRSQIKVWDLGGYRSLCTVFGQSYYYGFDRVWFDEREDMVYARHDGNEVSGFSLRKRGEKAPYELNRIQSSSLRLSRDRHFQAVCEQAEKMIASGLYHDALMKLEEARQIDGYSRVRRIIDLNEKAGKHCRRAGVRGVYQRLSREFPAGSTSNVVFRVNGEKVFDDDDSAEGRDTGKILSADHSRCLKVSGLHLTVTDASSGETVWQGNVTGNEKRRGRGLRDAFFLSDGRIIACQEYSLIFVRDGIEEYNNLFVIDPAKGTQQTVRNAVNVLRMAVLPDGSYGLLFNYEHDFAFFRADDLAFSEKMQLMPKFPEPLYEAQGYIYDADVLKEMKFSRDGRYLKITGTYRNTGRKVIRVFEIDWAYEK